MIFELRSYWTFPGQRDRWIRYMDDRIIPYMTRNGMTVVGSFVSNDDPDLYFWIRRFETEEERSRLYSAVYGAPEWGDDILPPILTMVDKDRVQVTIVSPTMTSGLR